MTDKFIKMCDVYRIFAKDFKVDLSQKAMDDMFIYESTGVGDINSSIFGGVGSPNGYAVGKRMLNITVSMWLEDLYKYGWYNVVKSIYDEEKFPRWWLDSVFKSFFEDKVKYYEASGMNVDRLMKDINDAKFGKAFLGQSRN